MQQLNLMMVSPEKQKLSFEEICPRWSKVLHRTIQNTDKCRFRQDHKILDMLDCKKCLVGEAHGFSRSYWDDCMKCNKFSSDFSMILYATPFERRTSIDKFVNHFNKAHL